MLPEGIYLLPILCSIIKNKLKTNPMKNLKKITRETLKIINGGDRNNRCRDIHNNPCTTGWCCNGTCYPYACIEP
ncbi:MULTISPECIES: bacteriocin-like protein [unclassified Chryseobacterium]|uniref:bacteriocin-like protein n=1 Tax=Chryseobacterium TaxID=59732 RepID=UPI0038D4B532